MNELDERVLTHLETYGVLATGRALQDYGITDLGQHIERLRKAGYAIVAEHRSVMKLGTLKTYEQFRLVEEVGT